MIDTSGAATALLAVLNGLSDLGTAQIGAPLRVGPQVSAYMTMGARPTQLIAQGRFETSTRFWVMFLYRVDKNETLAESSLMDVVDAFEAAIMADLTLNGTVQKTTIDSSAADDPQYQLRQGHEYREYPLIVTVVQRGAYEVTP